jgi:LacI family transcriptional regulator
LLSGGYLEYQSRLIPSESWIPPLRLSVPDAPYCPDDLKKICDWLKEHSPDAIIGIGSHLPDYLGSIGYQVPDHIGYVALGWSDDKLKGCAGYYLSEEKVGAAAVDSLALRLYQNERGLPECPITALLYGEFVEGKTLRKEGSLAGKAETVCL